MTQRVVNGMHLPNQGMWHIEQMLRAARDTGAVTILHHFMFSPAMICDGDGDPENENWYGKLRWGWHPQGIPPAPERLIHVRLYTANWRDWDAKEVARRAATMLANWRSAGRQGPVLRANLWEDPYVCVSPCNEQNLEPVGTKDYATMARWQLAFWDELDRLVPDRKALSCLGAFAFGGDVVADVPDSEYTVPEVRELCQRVDILATHPYAILDRPGGNATADPKADAYWYLLRDFRPEGWRDSRQPGHKHDIGGVLAQFPTKPLLITESGTFVHGDPGRNAETLAAMRLLLDTAAKSGRVLGVTWFIWNSGPEHAGNRIWPNSALRASMEALPDYPTTCRVPVRGGDMTKLVDVSEYQGTINWQRMKAQGVDGVYIRFGGGIGRPDAKGELDRRAHENVAGAMSVGLPWGPYWWYANGLNGQAQSAAFANLLHGYTPDFPPAMDWELEDAALTEAHVLLAVDTCEAKLGKPLFYTSTGWATKHRLDAWEWLRDSPLWLARYTTVTPPAPAPWAEWIIWQHSAGGNKQGAAHGVESTDIDLNVSRLGVMQLKALANYHASINTELLAAAAEAEHRKCGIRYNPEAALWREITEAGYFPVTNEFDYDDESGHYVAQRAENALGAVVFYWDARTGTVSMVPVR